MENSMGKGKDIKLVKELIFGDDIQKIEKRFDKITAQLESMEHRHQEEFKAVKQTLYKIDENQKKLKKIIDNKTSELHIGIVHHQNRLKTYIEETDAQIEQMKKSASENINILKSEMVMLIESKLHSVDRTKISHEQMADIFSSLAKELAPAPKEKKHRI